MGWTSDNGLGLLGLVDSRTDQIELFSFLKFIADQFWQNYEPNKIVAAQRPFAFIDFDAVIERNRRKFNKKILELHETSLERTKNELKANPSQIVEVSQIKVELGKRQASQMNTKKFLHSR